MQKTKPDSLYSTYDVIVVGAGSGGIAAAIQASRMGASTLLIETSAHLGGQLLAVPTMDEGQVEGQGYPIRQVGLYAEFIDRLRNTYRAKGKSLGTCYWHQDSIACEPRIAERILQNMLEEEPRITLLLRTTVREVFTRDHRVTGIKTGDGVTLSSKILIDATETGDLIPLTPARYRVGNSTSEEIDLEACLQDLTYPIVIKKYPGGAPEKLLLNSPPPGYEHHLEQFTATINEEGHNWYLSECGEHGDQPCWGHYPANWITHHAYRGLPNSDQSADYDASYGKADQITKTVLNWANDIPIQASYLEDPHQREKDRQRAKLKTLCFLYYLQSALGNEWSVSDAEVYEHDDETEDLPPALAEFKKHFPPHPYLRESRRIMPIRTLTGGEIKRVGSPPRAEGNFLTSAAVGYYPPDLHGCQEDAALESSLESSSDVPEGSLSGPFQIPFECLIPEKVDGFLAAEKNIGVSRIANGAIRLGPMTMVLGGVVGAIAGLAVSSDLQPREIDPLTLQRELLKTHYKLSLEFYTDVPRSHPLWSAVELVTVREWMGGTAPGVFGMDERCTREELGDALHALLGREISRSSPLTGSGPIRRQELREILNAILQGTAYENNLETIWEGFPRQRGTWWSKILAVWKKKLSLQDEITRGEAAWILTELVKD